MDKSLDRPMPGVQLPKGLLFRKLNTVFCKCGSVFELKPWHSAYTLVCKNCGNKDWSTKQNGCKGWFKASESRENILDEDRAIIRVAEIRMRVDLESKGVDIKRDTSELTILFESGDYVLGDEVVEYTDKRLSKFRSDSREDSNFLMEVYKAARPLWPTGRFYMYKGLVGLQILLKHPNLTLIERYIDCFPDIYDHFEGLDIQGTSPSAILGVPKGTLRWWACQEKYDRWHLRTLKRALRVLGPDHMRKLPTGYFAEVTCDLIEMGYKFKPLMNYLRRAEQYQGLPQDISTLLTLRDYARMNRDLGIAYERYPSSLRKAHDLTLRDYEIMKSEIEREKFAEVAEGAKHLEYRIGKLSIEVPKEPEDIKREGEAMKHCVTSYVGSMINGECLIVFARKDGDPAATIEIRNGSVVQAKGRRNRKPSEKILEFIREWSQAKGLRY